MAWTLKDPPNNNTYIVYKLVIIKAFYCKTTNPIYKIPLIVEIFCQSPNVYRVYSCCSCYRLSVHVRGSGLEPARLKGVGFPGKNPWRFLVKIDRYGNEIKAIMISSYQLIKSFDSVLFILFIPTGELDYLFFSVKSMSSFPSQIPDSFSGHCYDRACHLCHQVWQHWIQAIQAPGGSSLGNWSAWICCFGWSDVVWCHNSKHLHWNHWRITSDHWI